MTEEEKDLLIDDICSRLRHWPDIQLLDGGDIGYITEIDASDMDPVFSGYIPQDKEGYSFDARLDEFKLLLRSVDTMTEEERKEFWNLGGVMTYDPENIRWHVVSLTSKALDFVCKNRLDYRDLICKGLATEITKEHDIK